MLKLILFAGMLAAKTPSQTPAPAPAATVQEDPSVTALVLKIYGQMRKGHVDEALLTENMRKALSPEILAQNQPIFDQLGDPAKLTLEGTTKTAAGTNWVYLATFATAQLHVKIFTTIDGKVGGYELAV